MNNKEFVDVIYLTFGLFSEFEFEEYVRFTISSSLNSLVKNASKGYWFIDISFPLIYGDVLKR